MAKRTGPTNIQTQKLITELKELGRKQNALIWRLVADELARPARKRREANIGKIDLASDENSTVLVPGKVLSAGELTKKVTVAAWKFSGKAKEKINRKGKALSIQELMKANPKGSKVRIVG
ncbi:MAG: 50S ribosomal protein L18e [Nanoarchaeota archaeon]|nr:50S ribosomal protein L18e [Nanoarchaeota archaeon]